ncbi:unnamed protein product [Acanthoscelides obtectus]|uniref:CWF19-like protein 2 n=1 Tax=Acanthoscelides obtectus TaxID=200917 RepID=A0A9P0JP91_ACAOB|nr:unnamed protein product [Acanthoscelides obtectus]CAK1642962.1 CWF19-like protein 2 homolog [Acanthoscelides obtectus]
MGKHKLKKVKKSKKTKSKRESRTSSSSSDEWVEKNPEHSTKSSKYNEYSDSNDSEDSSLSDNRYSAKKTSKNKAKKYSDSDPSDDSTSKRNIKKIIKEYSDSDSDNEYQEKSASKQHTDSKREDWMSMSTTFSSTSNMDRRQQREENKRKAREEKMYDPRKCERELNPYWKDGGDGLPTFKKPSSEFDDFSFASKSDYKSRDSYKNRVSSWKKKPESDKSIPTSNRSSTSKPEEIQEKQIEPQQEEFTEKDLNTLAAKLVKAEIMGNTKLINELKDKLEHARANLKPSTQTEEVILTHTDSKGQSIPLQSSAEYGEPSRKKKKRIETHKDGQRTRYFADDDKYSLQQMFEREKYSTAESQDRDFVKMAGKISKKDDLDDIFSDNIRKEESSLKIESRNRDKAIREQQNISKNLENCPRCIQSDKMQKHLMVSMGETVYLAVPAHEPLTPEHCLIIPIRHVPCSTQLDENEWSEIRDIQKSLIKVFRLQNKEVVLFESAKYLNRFPHMCIQCVPLPNGEMTPIYFKKAIDESEMEWAQNKKLVSLNKRDVRRAIPKGLSYFAVNFGIEEGFAHVIEDERLFPDNFAQEVIGGMLDLHHSKWRKPRMQSFEEQSKRVTEFTKKWKDIQDKT